MKQKTKEPVSTRQQALDWWQSLPVWGVPSSKEYYMGLYYLDDTVTPKRIEEIWKKEARLITEQAAQWFSDKSFLEQYELSDKYCNSKNPSLLTTGQVEQMWLKETQNQSEEKTIEQYSDKRVNAKQFKEFNPDLFRAYIEKFSNQDKLKMLATLSCEISTVDSILNDLLDRISCYGKNK